MPRPDEIDGLTTRELRDAFLVSDLFKPGAVCALFTDLDRMVVGAACPEVTPLELTNSKETGRGSFLEQRELGTINLGGPGTVRADGTAHELGHLDGLYLHCGTRNVTFETRDPASPARFYFLSCPAHAPHPATVIRHASIASAELGAVASSNRRRLFKYIHEGGAQSCQLVMGLTALEEGCVWNSFPPHTHNRRTEVYLYFELGDRPLAHFMGEPSSTRHLFVHNEEAVLSPAWSVHCGCGFGNYKFIWGMAGENKRFDDMDPVAPLDLR
jgi:4-deoxy-L-threo-5-hexosulose-uronate ketol-isomerase